MAKKKINKQFTLLLGIFLFAVFFSLIILIISKGFNTNSDSALDNNHLTAFEDPEIVGFTFKYDPVKWYVEESKNSQICAADNDCFPSNGWYIRLTNKLNKVSLLFDLRFKKEDDEEIKGEFCFGKYDIEKVNSEWFRARNPGISAKEDEEKSWNRIYYHAKDVFSDIGKQCIVSEGINYYKHNTPPITLQGKPVELVVELQNSQSKDLVKIGDQVIETIEFK